MATTKKIVTSAFNVENARKFVDRVQSRDDAYYVYAGRHIPYEPDDSTLQQPTDSLQSSTFDVYNNMIFGKRVTSSDVAFMIPRYDWESGTVFTMYDHENTTLASSNFQCVVLSGSYYNVYKCLSNGDGAPSTVEPSGTDNAPFYLPNDGYMWKYMYSVPTATYNKFKTTNYIPFVANSSVEANATPGTIEHINVESAGRGYSNYIESAEFRSSDIQVGGSPTTYGITDVASSLDNYYEGCIIKMTSGVAADEYRLINSYIVSGGQKRITVESAFTNIPGATDTYEIYPYVYVFGDGAETANCAARAIIDPNTGNSVSRVEVLDPGANFRAAVAVIDIMDVVNVSQAAVLRPIMSPTLGHGSDPVKELYANRVGVSVKFSNTESGYIPSENDFRQIGLIRNPSFQNVDIAISLADSAGSFVLGESVRQYRNIVLAGTATVNLYSAAVVGTSTYFDTSVQAGDIMYLTDGTNRTFLPVSSVTNATHLTLQSNCEWTGTATQIALVNSNPYGVVSALATGVITVSNLNSGSINSLTTLYGNSSFATATVNTAAAIPYGIGGVEVNGLYDTFVEMTRFVGSVTSVNTAIIPDEPIRVDSVIPYTEPTARFHSYANSLTANVIYATNIEHIFNNDTTMSNEANTVSFQISNKFDGDLVRDSGEVLYVENVDPISRASNKSETIKIVLEF